jgi:hypothetical protein
MATALPVPPHPTKPTRNWAKILIQRLAEGEGLPVKRQAGLPLAAAETATEG